VTVKPRSYGVVHREMIPEAIHSTEQAASNRAEQFQSLLRCIGYQATRVRERGMRKLKSVTLAQRPATARAAVFSFFSLGIHLVRAQHYRALRTAAFDEWSRPKTGIPLNRRLNLSVPSVELFDNIPRGEGGKFENFVS
jgi:putative transposase